MAKGQARSLVVLATVLAIAVVVLWSVVRETVEPEPPQDPAGREGGESAPAEVDAAAAAQTLTPALPERPWYDLAPDDVINSPDCRIVAGTGSAQDIAVVVGGSDATGIWYAVVDWQGGCVRRLRPVQTLRGCRPPQNPHGGVLVGLRGSGHGWTEAWLVHDGQTIYQADEAWHFNVSPDGSSFYAVEPLAGDASRLVIRNFTEEPHHDLGDTQRRTYGGHRVAFSVTHDEVIIHPAGWPDARWAGTYRFYPVDGGEPREVRIPDDSHTALFQSSEVSYHVDYQADTARLSRVNRRFDGTGEEIRSDEAWSRDFPLDEIGRPSMAPFITDDGTRLVWATELAGLAIDTSSGATVTSVPLDRENRVRRGDPTRIHFRDGRILLYRYMDAVDVKPVGDRFVEIFDAAKPNVSGIPDSRVPIGSVPRKRFDGFALIDDAHEDPSPHPRYARSKTPCAEAALLDGRGLVAVDDRLAYRVAAVPIAESRPDS